jgi:glycosyltransferase involved in cell wall biosynthesis
LESSTQKNFFGYCTNIRIKRIIDKKKIFDSQKIKFLPDAIIDPNYLIKKNINHIFKKFNKKKIIFSAGRLTKQKNFLYLIEEFKNFLKVNDQYILILLGEGEEKEKLKKKVINEKLKENVFLMGHVNNIYDYFRQGELFVLSSLWEDPGFVLIEAAVANLFVVSSNCPNGPKEFLDYGKSGLLYHSNKKGALCKALIDYTNLSNKKKKILQLKKKTLTYTKFRHHKVLRKLLT